MTRSKLLLADDSVTIRKVVELTFADEGIEVTTVADGDSAMSRFIDVQPDIVLVDVGLPGTTGYDLCEMIKSDESTRHIPVLLLVGSFEPFDQDAAERSGADGFLTKPFHSIRDLVNRVHELLGTQTQESTDEVIDFDTTISNDDENDDIDDLYERSFAETVPIENFETVPAFGVDDAFADEIIDEERLTGNDNSLELASEESPETADESETLRHESASDAGGDIAEVGASADESRGDASDPSVGEWLDDEMIETISGASDEEVQTAETEAIEAVARYEDAPAAAVDIEPIKEFDWSPAAIVTAADEREIGAAAGFSTDFEPEEHIVVPESAREEHVTEEPPNLQTDEMPEISHEQADGHFAAEPSVESQTVDETSRDAAPIAELSPELIDVIVRRVVERLSDRAVREVAQEAVPRIAERLMREALEEDKNR